MSTFNFNKQEFNWSKKEPSQCPGCGGLVSLTSGDHAAKKMGEATYLSPEGVVVAKELWTCRFLQKAEGPPVKRKACTRCGRSCECPVAARRAATTELQRGTDGVWRQPFRPEVQPGQAAL